MHWFSRRRRAAHHGHDFADYGTAFGLDMSLEAQLVTPATPDTSKTAATAQNASTPR
ncbi:MAG: hypothetical protein RJA44_1646 [Pseudomonadota bacterium]